MKVARIGTLLFKADDFVGIRTHYKPAKNIPATAPKKWQFWRKAVPARLEPEQFTFDLFLSNRWGTQTSYNVAFDTAEARDAVMNRLLHQINNGEEVPDALLNPAVE